MCFSVENGGKGGVFHEVNAAGALMKFAYDTMWGVSALVPFFLFFFDGLLMDLLCAGVHFSFFARALGDDNGKIPFLFSFPLLFSYSSLPIPAFVLFPCIMSLSSSCMGMGLLK